MDANRTNDAFFSNLLSEGELSVSAVGLASDDRGTIHVNAKLNAKQIAEIRATYIPHAVTIRDFASRYGVSSTVVHRINHSESYQ